VGGAQLPDLRFDALAVRRYPCIGMTHGMICPYILHLKTPFFSMGFSRCEFLDFRTYELQRGSVKTSKAGESQAIISIGIKSSSAYPPTLQRQIGRQDVRPRA
jgi:hypothetical protein